MWQKLLQQRLIDIGNALYRGWHGVHEPKPGVQAEYASWARRATAVALDGTVYLFLAFIGFVIVASPFLSQAKNHPNGATEQLFAILAFAVFVLGPAALLSPFLLARHGRRNGQTMGKRLMRIRVVRDDGHEWTFRTAFWRQFMLRIFFPLLIASALGGLGVGARNLGGGPTTYLGVLLEAAGVVWLVIFGLWPLREGERRGLHDKLAGSHVRLTPYRKKTN